MDDAVRRRRDADERQDVAEPERLQHRQVEPAGGLGDVPERVRARVAVVGGVGQLAGAAGVDDDDEGPLVTGADLAAAAAAQRSFARGCASK